VRWIMRERRALTAPLHGRRPQETKRSRERAPDRSSAIEEPTDRQPPVDDRGLQRERIRSVGKKVAHGANAHAQRRAELELS
jgi:hypothetical protein